LPHWNVHPPVRHHLSLLRCGWRKFGRKLRVDHEKASYGSGLIDIGFELMAAELTSVPPGESVAASTPVAGPLTPSSARRSSALQLIKVGGKSRLVCPADLAYGATRAGPC